MIMQNKNIFIVEDEGIVALDLKKRLSFMGYNVLGSSTSAEESIEKIKSLKPNLVIMDIKLRGRMNGIEASLIIKNKFNIPVVFLTANNDPQTLQEAKLSEPYGYILKPFEVRDLQNVIEIALYKHSLDLKVMESEKKFRYLFLKASDPVLIFNKNLTLDSFNEKAADILGYAGTSAIELFKITIEQIFIGLNFKKIINSEKKNTKHLYQDHLFEVFALRKDKEKIPVEVSFSIIKIDDSFSIIFIFRDISKRKNEEKELQKSTILLEEKVNEQTNELRYLVDKFPYGIKICNTEGKEIFSNRKYKNYEFIIKTQSNNETAKSIGKKKLTLYPKELLKIVKTKKQVDAEKILIKMENSEEVILTSTFFPILDERGDIFRIVFILEDITERLKTDKIKKELEEKKIHSALVLEKLEEERYRISRELHDNIGQILYAIKYGLEIFEKSDRTDFSHIKYAKNGILALHKELTNIIYSLQPVILENFGLIKALQKLTQDFSESTKIKSDFISKEEKINLDKKVNLNIYRIIQEALNNIMKYSEATKVILRVSVDKKEYIFSIKDNGVGFDLGKINELRKAGFGLNNMKERALLINSNIKIDSKINKGTEIILRVPSMDE